MADGALSHNYILPTVIEIPNREQGGRGKTVGRGWWEGEEGENGQGGEGMG